MKNEMFNLYENHSSNDVIGRRWMKNERNSTDEDLSAEIRYLMHADAYVHDNAISHKKIFLRFRYNILPTIASALDETDNSESTCFIISRSGSIYQLIFPELECNEWPCGKEIFGDEKSKAANVLGVFSDLREMILPNGHSDDKAYLGNTKFYQNGMAFAQYRSLAKLVRYLSDLYNIPKHLLDEAIIEDFFHGHRAHEAFSYFHCDGANVLDIPKALNWDVFIDYL